MEVLSSGNLDGNPAFLSVCACESQSGNPTGRMLVVSVKRRTRTRTRRTRRIVVCLIAAACINGYYGNGTECMACPTDTFSSTWNDSGIFMEFEDDCDSCAAGFGTNGTIGQTACTRKPLLLLLLPAPPPPCPSSSSSSSWTVPPRPRREPDRRPLRLVRAQGESAVGEGAPCVGGQDRGEKHVSISGL